MNIGKIKPAKWFVLSLILLVLVVSALAYCVFVPKLQELDDVNGQISLAKQHQAGLLNIQVPPKITAADKAALAVLVPVDFDQSRFLETIRQEETDSGATIASIVFTDGTQGTTTKPDQSQSNVAKSGPSGVLVEQHGTLRVVGQYGQVRKFLEAFSKMSRLVSFRGWNFTVNEQVPPPAPAVQQPTDASVESAVSAPVTKDPLPHDNTQLPSKHDSDKVTNQTPSQTGTLRTQQNPAPAHLEIQQTPTTFTLEISFTIYDVPTAKDLLSAPTSVPAQ